MNIRSYSLLLLLAWSILAIAPGKLAWTEAGSASVSSITESSENNKDVIDVSVYWSHALVWEAIALERIIDCASGYQRAIDRAQCYGHTCSGLSPPV